MSLPQVYELTNYSAPLASAGQSSRPTYFSPDTGTILPALPHFRGSDSLSKVDLQGGMLAPGYLEVQINGIAGVHFTTLGRGDRKRDEEALDQVSRELAARGVTAWWATVPTVEPRRWKEILPALKPRAFANGATLLGAHVEGPYLAPTKHGAHEPSFFQAPASISPVDLYGAENLRDVIKLITLAPELPGALEVIQLLRFDFPHIVISLGHSAATYEEGQAGLRAGARGLTHIYNAMDGLRHREPGLVGLISNNASLSAADDRTGDPQQHLLASNVTAEEWLARQMRALHPAASGTDNHSGEAQSRPEVYYSVIPDLIHLHPAVLTMAVRTSPDHCILITDAIELAGLADGTYPPNDQITTAQVKAGHRATKAGTDTLIGSCITLDVCVRNMMTHAGCTLAEAVRCVTQNVARYLGEDRNGRGGLDVGCRADFVVLDPRGVVRQTWIAGVKVFDVQRAGDVHG